MKTARLRLVLALTLAALGGLMVPLRAASPASTVLSRSDLAAYHGWIKYLAFRAADAEARSGAAAADAIAAEQRLTDWAQRILNDPTLLTKLRGVQEWAYESPVDDSGQPFQIMIPTDYDPARPAPVSVYMHGLSGNHLEHATGVVARPGGFEISVLGRARGAYYAGLAEADVLHVLDYVQAHWAIYLSRVHLGGGSMGGGATFRFGSRYPHRFASGRPTCGYASDKPLGNFLTFPLYATHSDDDPTVSVLLARGPMNRLRDRGGQAIFDETTGLGHAAWNYTAGNERGAAWQERQVRPASREVRHIDYTAFDGQAKRGWWAEIAEWGDAPRPARFVLRAGTDNTLHATLENVTRLRIMTAASPLDVTRAVHVSVNGLPPYTIPAPVPASFFLRDSAVPDVMRELVERPDFRPHTPGGPLQLYNGEPLLIVYGTNGDAATNAAMQAAATAASKSANSNWLADGGAASPDDGVPHAHLLYGHLRVRADTDITEEDVRRCHLVLIGTAAQNQLVARLASRLPVQLRDGTIACSDGFSVPAHNRALALVHYNPLAPTRLIYWVASDDARAYAAGSPVVALTAMQPHGRTWVGTDLVIADATEMTLVATRSFDRHWQWVRNRENSPLLPEALRSHRAFGAAVAESVRRAAAADFALASSEGLPDVPAIVPGVTRTVDVLPLRYFEPVGIMDLTGAELLTLRAALDRTSILTNEDGWVRVHPQPDATAIEPAQVYRVALPVYLVWTVGRAARIAPRTYRETDLQVADALERFLGRAP